MNIYTAIDRTPYTYLIGWSKLNKWYYGCRYAKNCHPSDLFVTYQTSSKYVAQFIKDNGLPDIIQIRNTFYSKDKALIHEHKILRRLNAKKNPKFLNESNGFGDSFADHTGKKQSPEHISKRTLKRIGLKHSSETKLKMSSKAKDKTHVFALDGSIIRISINDPRFLSGELTSISKGKFTAVDSVGNTYRITKEDPRYISGELVAQSKGRSYIHTVPTLREFITSISPKSKGNSWFKSEELKQNIRTSNEIFELYLKPLGFTPGRKVHFV